MDLPRSCFAAEYRRCKGPWPLILDDPSHVRVETHTDHHPQEPVEQPYHSLHNCFAGAVARGKESAKHLALSRELNRHGLTRRRLIHGPIHAETISRGNLDQKMHAAVPD